MQPSSSLESRIDTLEFTQQAMLGHLKAMEYGLRATLSSHPNLPVLKHLWASMLPSIADAHLPGQEGVAEHPMYHAALKQGLALMTQQIQAACDVAQDSQRKD